MAVDDERCTVCDRPHDVCFVRAARVEYQRLEEIVTAAITVRLDELRRNLEPPDDYAAYHAATDALRCAVKRCTPYDWRAEALRLRAQVAQLQSNATRCMMQHIYWSDL